MADAYFNARALREAGLDQPSVEMLRELFERSGGTSSDTTLNAIQEAAQAAQRRAFMLMGA